MFIVNVRLVLPAGTRTVALAGQARGGFAETCTTMPPVGALPVNVTVAETLFPPRVLVVDSRNVPTSGGSTWSWVETDEIPWVAMIVAKVVCKTGFVVTENVALVAFCGIVTVAGTVAADGYELASDTAKPPAGAGVTMRTTPLTIAPPVTLLELS